MTEDYKLPSPEDDGQPIPEVGDWSRHKHHFLSRYLNAFTTAMRPKRWNGLHYIDLFAGAGIERLKDTRELDWGSPLIAAQLRVPFDRLHLCEKNKDRHDALAQRLARISLRQTPQLLAGDANDRVEEITKEIPSGALSVAFLDPYGLHLDFSTVKVLAARRVDLIIFFPDRIDALRNWKIYEAIPNSNLDRFMGQGADWLGALKRTPQERWAESLLDVYTRQIQKLGYAYFEYERICKGVQPLYQLLFYSKHKAGTTIWRNVAKLKPDGQRTFGFEA